MDVQAALDAMEGVVRSLARRYADRDHDLWEDLCQEGRVAVIAALPRWRPERSALSTFMTYQARGRMQHYLRDRGRMIHLPGWVQERRVQGPTVVSLDAMIEDRGGERLPALARDDRVEAQALDRVWLDGVVRRAGVSNLQMAGLCRRLAGLPSRGHTDDGRVQAARQKLRAARARVEGAGGSAVAGRAAHGRPVSARRHPVAAHR